MKKRKIFLSVLTAAILITGFIFASFVIGAESEENPQSINEILKNRIVSDGCIKGVAAGTKVSEMIDITPYVKVFSADGKTELSADDIVGSGCVVRLYDGEGGLIEGATVFIKGDLDGNGSVDAFDYVALRLAVLKIEPFACDHIIVTDEAVESTCEHAGLTEGTHCAICGEILTPQEEIPQVSHSYKNGVCIYCGEKYYSRGMTYLPNSDKSGYVLTGIGTCTDKKIIIPEKYNGLPVTEICDNALSDCTDIVSVVIPNTVTVIGKSVLKGCDNLCELTVPFVGKSPDGKAKTSINDTYIGYLFGAEENVVNGAHYPVKDNIPVGLYSITVTDADTIPDYAFYGCKALTTVIVPDDITYIGKYAFYGCYNLVTLDLPDSITGIGEYAFYNCTYLEEFEIPAGVTSIGEYAFYYCKRLKSAKLSYGAQTIENYAFYGCENLIDIYIPETVTKIGSKVFNLCKYVENLTVPFIGSDADHLYDLDYFFGQGWSSLKNVTVTKAKTIKKGTFVHYTSVTSITISDSVTEIEYGAFKECIKLESITLPFVGQSRTGLGYFGYIFGATNYSYNQTMVPSTLKTVVITDATDIDADAFENCSSIESITIEGTVKTINSYAFKNCTSLTSFVVPDSVTLIAYRAFENCTGLTSVTIGTGVETIGSDAFIGCTALKTIVIPPNVQSIGSYAFDGCTSLTDIYFTADLPEKLGRGWFCNATIHRYFKGENQ